MSESISFKYQQLRASIISPSQLAIRIKILFYTHALNPEEHKGGKTKAADQHKGYLNSNARPTGNFLRAKVETKHFLS
jgi:hypothetical protein